MGIMDNQLSTDSQLRNHVSSSNSSNAKNELSVDSNNGGDERRRRKKRQHREGNATDRASPQDTINDASQTSPDDSLMELKKPPLSAIEEMRAILGVTPSPHRRPMQ